MAGQFFARFGDRVAILHSAFTDVERTEQWRRIRSGAASAAVGSGAAVFAPVRNLDGSISMMRTTAPISRKRIRVTTGATWPSSARRLPGACVVLGSATPSRESRYNAEREKYTLVELPGRIEARPMPTVELIDMRQEFLEDAPTGHVFAQAGGGHRRAPGEWRADHRAAESPRIFQLRGLARLRRARELHELLATPSIRHRDLAAVAAQP